MVTVLTSKGDQMISYKSGFIIHLFLITTLSLVACVPTSGEGPTLNALAASPTPSEALRMDAQSMAGDLGISVDEAVRRLQLQDGIGLLNARLQEAELEEFAGLWIQHEPEYRIFIAYVEDGDEILAEYLSGLYFEDEIELKSAQYSYVQLQEDQQAVSKMMQDAGFSLASGINIQKNQVELYITDVNLFNETRQEKDLTLPPSVVVVEVYEPVGEPPPFPLTPVPDVAMPQLKARSASTMAALMEGTLIIEDGCLKIDPSYPGENMLVIWQADYFLTDKKGTLTILDEQGKETAWVGEAIQMGGGEVGLGPELQDQLREPAPSECFEGKVWLMGEILAP
jgi:hypothetical protein